MQRMEERTTAVKLSSSLEMNIIRGLPCLGRNDVDEPGVCADMSVTVGAGGQGRPEQQRLLRRRCHHHHREQHHRQQHNLHHGNHDCALKKSFPQYFSSISTKNRQIDKDGLTLFISRENTKIYKIKMKIQMKWN